MDGSEQFHLASAPGTSGPRGYRTGLSIVAVELAVMFIGATLPTPLYPAYARAFEFGAVTLTLVYAVYVLGNLAALLFFGRLSDQIGRRLVTLAAVAFGIASTLLFLFASGTAWLFAARVLSGLATGLAAGPATAWIAELEPRGDKANAAAIATAANFAGLALAPLLGGLLAQFAPWPLRLPYLVYIAMLVAIGLAVLVAPETVSDRAHRYSELSLRPRLGLPKEVRPAFLAPAFTAFATFALIGFYAALLPTMLQDSLREGSPAVSGAIVFELFLVAATVAALTGTKTAGRTAMLSGLALLPPSLALLLAAEAIRSMPVLILTTVLAGVAAALGYRGSLELVNRIAPDDRRSEVVSAYLIAVYMGNSLPIIGIGLLSRAAGPMAAHIAFAAVIGVVAAAALATGWKYAPATAPPGR